MSFHAGEQAMHRELGIEPRMAEIGRRVVRDHLPDQHRAFYAQLPALFVGSVGADGAPWASVLVGLPGFVRAPDEHTLAVRTRVDPADPWASGLVVGGDLGFLGIELETRRRNRVSGRVRSVSPSGFEVDVEETVGNCPQYIHRRAPTYARDPRDPGPEHTAEALTSLDAEAIASITAADTMFVASRARDDGGGGGGVEGEGLPHPFKGTGGADMSHRGGPAGFVRVEDPHTLLIPDYPGNFFFMTLGNLRLHPRAGLLFVDFATGDLLQLTGATSMVDDPGVVAGLAGADRAWRLHITKGVRRRDALALRWTPGDARLHSTQRSSE